MARIRSIKPELFSSRQVMNLSFAARLLFIGLISQADDEGRGSSDPRRLRGAIFPGDEEITSVRVLELLGEVESQGLAVTYEANGHGPLYALPTWRDHQYVEKARKSHYPAPPNTVAKAHSPNDRGNEGESSGNVGEPAGTIPVGSDLKDLKDLNGSLTRARAESSHPVDNSARRARAPDRLKKPTEPEEIERRRREAARLVEQAAAAAAAAKP